MNIGEDFASFSAALDIETGTVPRAMIMAVLTVLRLSLWTVGHCPLRYQIPLCDRQKSGQPEHHAVASQRPKDLLSRLRQHDRFDTTVPPALYEDPPKSWNDLVTPKM